jgi:tetratricopeptide (TPR) repeat protein
VAVWLASGLAASPVASIGDALDQYNRGEFSAAVKSVNTSALTAGMLTSDAERWIAAGDAMSHAHRQMIAAAFAIDLVWAATRTTFNANADNRDRLKILVNYVWQNTLVWNELAECTVTVWARRAMPTSGPVASAEHAWWLASTGMLEDTHAWHELIGGQLGPARARVPGEPRWRLAEVLAHAGEDLGSLRETSSDRQDLLRDEALASQITHRIPHVEQDLAALEADTSLAGEAELHIGYLELRLRQWDSALAHFDRARQLTTEPFLIETADYLSGWVYERMGRPADAVVAYRRVHAMSPRMRNVSTLLAAQLFLTNERAEAYTILNTALTAEPAPFDLLTMFERGGARFVPGYIASMREALR